ncbi:MAG: glutamine--fructose-6-phosphate transaminase (isomerizing) [Gammaproteobacteria bacterium]|nr:glutamine--fructose-6-phosphate transaminase (isomerizing) [Gammaproteobacteria bacterium]
MCGIVGVVSTRQVPDLLVEGLQRLEYRGYDSAGIAVLDANQVLKRRRTIGKVKELADSLRSDSLSGVTGIAHTRWATHGVPSEGNAHPHVYGETVALAHNGIVENHEALREELVGLGSEFTSDTDTEVIVHLIGRELANTDSLLDAVRRAVKRLEGAFAIGVISSRHPGRLIGARKGSPLVVGLGHGENFIASDVLALRSLTDRFILLEEGDLVELTPSDVSVWNLDDESVVRSSVKVEMRVDDTGKGNFQHYMHKEIHQQPQAVAATLEGRVTRHRVLEEAFGVRASSVFDRTRAITIVACGSSYYSASIARYWIEDLVGIPCNVEIASEFRYRRGVVLPGSLFVTITQSGETADTLAALRLVKEQGFEASLTICNVPTSTTVRESDLALMIQAGPEIGVASTKAFTAQLVDLMLLTILLGRRHRMSEDTERELVGALRGLPDVLEEALKLDVVTRKLAQRLVDKHHALFLGRGAHYPVALEGALKLKEISYIHAEALPAGELKHGPLALVDAEMPVIAVAPNNDLLEKLKSNLQEVRARGGELIVFADETLGFRTEPGVTVVEVPSVHEALAPIVFTVALQLLAYHTAALKGTDLDQPRNLAKSVTVE